ncbi:hypothetical protein B5X24_HaOG205329 [Helicoverpa armigera]|uniref:Uncharacterized protein n=1 Tax=Helicoverpa armigera TaxID=29058 RepID=A0A2W1BTH7_HELAM|nr:hypothetical protein B5X24_HaOG205329 [Helicoverpa armigera]
MKNKPQLKASSLLSQNFLKAKRELVKRSHSFTQTTGCDKPALLTTESKSEIDQTEWLEMITELCILKQLDEPKTLEMLINCGLPGETPVDIPMYRTFFGTYKSKNLLEGQTSVANKLAGQK